MYQRHYCYLLEPTRLIQTEYSQQLIILNLFAVIDIKQMPNPLEISVLINRIVVLSTSLANYISGQPFNDQTMQQKKSINDQNIY